jgi:DNA polymerase elongation subunit (family B)
MYRSVNYNPFNESVFLRTWTPDGDRIDTEIPFRPYLYVEKEGSTDATSIFKTSLLKKSFKNSIERRRFVDGTANKRLFHNLTPEQQFLIEMFKDQNNKPEFSQFPLKTYFLDIETASFGEFPVPEKAKDPISLITLYDTITKTTHTWGLEQNYTPTLENCYYYRCKDEQDLAVRFVDFWKSDYPDICSGWNSFGFDIPYIINRFTRLFGEEFVQQLSPVRRVTGRKIFTDTFGKEMTKWSIGGISCIDYLEIYKTFSIGERESYSLNYISEIELGEGKVRFNATSLAELSKTDWIKISTNRTTVIV